MFTPLESAIGAILIQRATTNFLAETGRTVGFSSVLYQSVLGQNPISLAIATGLLASTLVAKFIIPDYIVATELPLHKTILSGLLVGLGTSWGFGCTSGHMLCGLSLLRKRSFVATLTFCTTAMLMANLYTANYLPDCSVPCYNVSLDLWERNYMRLVPLAIGAIILSNIRVQSVLFSAFKTGLVFGLGLFISGMANPEKPLRFLSIFHLNKFDPSLFMIVLFAILPNIIQWRGITASKPLLVDRFSLPSLTTTPPKFILGNALFGLGWGLLGVCPGPGMVNSLLSYSGLAWVVSFLVAGYISRI